MLDKVVFYLNKVIAPESIRLNNIIKNTSLTNSIRNKAKNDLRTLETIKAAWSNVYDIHIPLKQMPTKMAELQTLPRLPNT